MIKEKILDLAIKLCDIDSITYNENEVCEYVESFLLKNDIVVQRIFLEDDKGRFNLFAYKQKKIFYRTIFCTHLDTVGPFFKPRVDSKQQKLYARGACDAKGIAASMLYAFLELLNSGHEDMALLFTVGEEIISDGAKKIASALNIKANTLVVGEPTGLRYASHQMGALSFDLVSKGKKAHSALFHLGQSAIHALIQDCSKILNYKWPKNDFGENLINIGQITGGIASNIVSDYALAKIIFRINQEPDFFIQKIDDLLSDNISMTINSSTSPFEYYVPKNEKSFIATFGSDAPYLKFLAEKIILFGPGKLEYAHTDEEHIDIEELEQGYNHYMKIAIKG